MIDKAEAYIWKTARVLEQRRFEVLFKDGDPAAVKAPLDPHKTADGGYGYAPEPDWPVAPWWAIGTEGSLLATSLLFAPLSKHVAHLWLGRAETFLWGAVDAID